MHNKIRNRIVAHVQVRAGDLVPHELNFRQHSTAQASALKAVQQQVGFARSLLGFYLPDGRIKLIDGHLRAALDPEQIVTVEIVDVNDKEAKALLAAIDPLAALAGTDNDAYEELLKHLQSDAETAKVCQALTDAELDLSEILDNAFKPTEFEPRYCVLIDCENEDEQKQLLAEFQARGLTVEAKLA